VKSLERSKAIVTLTHFRLEISQEHPVKDSTRRGVIVNDENLQTSRIGVGLRRREGVGIRVVDRCSGVGWS
jgi:hypothetical protein